LPAQDGVFYSLKYIVFPFRINFRRFYFGYKGRTAEILWLSNERKFIPDSLEKFLEKEFKKVG
jgi:hypothetical protein